MKSDKILMLGAIFCLVVVNFLTFHDILEPHTIRDWLTLFSTILVFWYFAKELSPAKRKK